MSSFAANSGFTRLSLPRIQSRAPRDLLIKQRVHCSDLANLNDPWDCRPWFSALPESWETKLAAIAAVEQMLQSDPTSLLKRAAEQKQQYPEINVEAERVVSKLDFEIKRRRLSHERKDDDSTFQTPETLDLVAWGTWAMLPYCLGIYCLTPHPDSTLMWSHYADRHRGICLEFSCDDNALFGFAQQVTYRSTYPNLKFKYIEEKGLEEIVLTKAADWSYEDEYRIVARKSYMPTLRDEPVVEQGFIRLPPGVLVSVIAGCEADLETLGNLVKRCSPNLKIKRAIRSYDGYKLKISTLD